jgi:hypothetical protein
LGEVCPDETVEQLAVLWDLEVNQLVHDYLIAERRILAEELSVEGEPAV